MKKRNTFLFMAIAFAGLLLACNDSKTSQGNDAKTELNQSEKDRLYEAKHYTKYAQVRQQLIEVYRNYSKEMEEVSPKFKTDLDLVVKYENLEDFVEQSASVDERTIEVSLEGMEFMINILKEKNKQ